MHVLSISIKKKWRKERLSLSKINYEVEKSKKLLTVQEKKNESLIMKISELASLDKIQEVADQEGLSYNNNNIKTIGEE